MEIAIVDGNRCRAYPNAKGQCEYCEGAMDAKCGKQKMWHGAHHRKTNCDRWWENETDWHRPWKSHFPEDWREILHISPSGEKHIADVKTPNGTVFEFQNSPMSKEEMTAREDFYGQVIWVVKGEKFKSNFTVLDRLPDPETEFTRDLVFHQQSLSEPCFSYWVRSPSADVSESYRSGCILSPEEPGEDGIPHRIDEAYVGHHWFDWKHRREVWFASNQRVLIDSVVPNFTLAELLVYSDYGDYRPVCVRFVSATALIEEYGGTWCTNQS